MMEPLSRLGRTLASAAIAGALAAPAAAQAPRFALTMAEAATAARAHALDVRAASEDSASARSDAEAAFAPLLPRLTLDGGYRYQAEVPAFAAAAGAPPRPFGSHRATSVGPTLSWTLWDDGALRKTWRARQASARSQEERERLFSAQATQAARLAYVQVQLAREKARLLAEAVAVADAQYADIEGRRRAGAASRIDSLSSHQADLQRRKDFLSAQADLACALRELFQLTGLGAGLDLTRPMDLSLELDSLADVPAELAAVEASSGPRVDHPGALAYARQADSARLSADAESAGAWPRIQFQGAVAYEYPNGPALESVTQKSAGLTASLPLFEGRESARRAEKHRHLAAAAQRRRELVVEQFARDWDRARAELAALRGQAALDATAVVEAEELARLVHLSYQGGRSTFLEVQTYDLAALRAKVNAAQTRAQILIHLATLAQLSTPG